MELAFPRVQIPFDGMAVMLDALSYADKIKHGQRPAIVLEDYKRLWESDGIPQA